MTDILNPIFHPVKKFNNEESIKCLEKYMLFHNCSIIQKKQNFINKQDQNTIINETLLAETINEHKSTVILPKKTDTLFWCMYIAMYGYDEYNLITHHYGNKELEEKQKMLDYFKKNPGKIKDANMKISKVKFQEMISELMIDKKISLSFFVLFSLFYNIDVLIVYKKTYIEFSTMNNEEDKSVFLIYRNNDKEYEIDLDSTTEKISNIVDNYLKIESSAKILKGISCYTVNDLKEIYKKIFEQNSIDENEKNKQSKPDIYNSILLKCVW